MKLSFDDEESFKETVENMRFSNPPSDPNAHQQIGSISSMPLENSERNEENIIPSDPISLRRVPLGCSGSLSVQEEWGYSSLF